MVRHSKSDTPVLPTARQPHSRCGLASVATFVVNMLLWLAVLPFIAWFNGPSPSQFGNLDLMFRGACAGGVLWLAGAATAVAGMCENGRRPLMAQIGLALHTIPLVAFGLFILWQMRR